MKRLPLAVLSCLALLAPPPTAARSPSDDVLRANDAYRAHVLRHRPDLATRFGWSGGDLRLEPITEATIERDAAWLAGFDSTLAAIDRAALGWKDLAALDSLQAKVARERAPLESGAWRRDPMLYFDLVPGAIFDVARSSHLSACERARRVARRLRAVPEVLRSARINLRDGSGADVERAVAAWREGLDSLRTLPARLSNCREATRLAELVVADTLALASGERFLQFLREEYATAPRPPGGDRGR